MRRDLLAVQLVTVVQQRVHELLCGHFAPFCACTTQFGRSTCSHCLRPALVVMCSLPAASSAHFFSACCCAGGATQVMIAVRPVLVSRLPLARQPATLACAACSAAWFCGLFAAAAAFALACESLDL